jgi:hypothetical protein
MKQKYKRYLRAIKESTRFFLIVAIVEIGLIVLIIRLLQANLLDTRTMISVVIPEVGISVLLYYLLGQKRCSQIDEAIKIMEAFDKFSHLTIYTFSVLPFPFSVIFSYVANTHTKEVFIAPKYIDHLTEQDILTKIKCKNEKEMKDILTKGKFNLNERKPSLDELKSNK